jgi:hypothetical protein
MFSKLNHILNLYNKVSHKQQNINIVLFLSNYNVPKVEVNWRNNCKNCSTIWIEQYTLESTVVHGRNQRKYLKFQIHIDDVNIISWVLWNTIKE